MSGLHDALVALFGGEPEQIHVSHLDHLCCALTPDRVEKLLRAGGGPWAAILDRVGEKRAQIKAAKDPGLDLRLTRQEKAAGAT